VFIVVVAFLLVLILGALAFTDVVEDGTASLKSALARAIERARANNSR
jgi:hypothetical protein